MQEASKHEARRVGIAMLLGLGFGLVLYFAKLPHLSDYVEPIGTIFIRLLKMVIVPMVFSSIFMSMINLGTPEALGSMGRKAVGYFAITNAIAVLIGIFLVNLVQPGVGASLGTAGLQNLDSSISHHVQKSESLFSVFVDVIIEAIPQNPFEAMANADVLQLISFAIMFGITALYYRKQSEPVINFMRSLERMSFGLAHGVMKFAPLGVFALILHMIAQSGFGALASLSKYIGTVIIGLIIHFTLLLIIGSVRSKKSPLLILRSVSPALITAFSTSSSAATLPITMANTEQNLGVHPDTAKFVLPLGTTVNMDGTALYEAVAAIFIAQAYGIELSFAQQVIVFFTSALAAVGAAAIPGAGLITMSIVLSAVNLPLEGIGLILAVDRLLDMFRTTVNVFGDCIGAIWVDSVMDRPKTSD